MICLECRVDFVSLRPRARFCCRGCKDAYHNRDAALGRVLIPIAKAWRLSRGGGMAKELALYTHMCRLLDEANREDKAAGRASAKVYMRTKAERYGVDARQ